MFTITPFRCPRETRPWPRPPCLLRCPVCRPLTVLPVNRRMVHPGSRRVVHQGSRRVVPVRTPAVPRHHDRPLCLLRCPVYRPLAVPPVNRRVVHQGSRRVVPVRTPAVPRHHDRPVTLLVPPLYSLLVSQAHFPVVFRLVYHLEYP